MTTERDFDRMADGTLPKYTSLGCYPVFYITKDCGVLCADCANGKNGSLAYVGTSPDGIEDGQWKIVVQEANWEDPELYCEHCNGRIESAYADDDSN
jgi:hypothetical protein